MANLSEVGVNFSTYLASLSPQIKNNSLQWYLSGSLGTIMMAGAESITEIKLDEENNLIGETTSKEITEEQREKLRKFSRKLGVDIDVVNVNGDLFGGAPSTNKPHIQSVIQNVPEVLDLMSWSPSYDGCMYIDVLEADRKISYHPVARVKTQKGDVYVTAPPEQLAHKLSETIFLCDRLFGENVNELNKSKYQKDIKDLSSMFYGFKDLYENDEFLARIYQALKEKKSSLFSIHNPIFNSSDNAIKGQEILEKYIMRRIIEDSREYLRTITDDKSDMELNAFFNSLLDRRKADVEKFSRNQPHNSATPLQQRESELSALEAKAEEYDNQLANIGKEGQEIGEE